MDRFIERIENDEELTIDEFLKIDDSEKITKIIHLFNKSMMTYKFYKILYEYCISNIQYESPLNILGREQQK